MKEIYLSEEVIEGINDLELYEDNHIYNLEIETMIFFNKIEELKSCYLRLLEGCKNFLEEQGKFFDTSKNLYDFSIDYKVFYDEDMEMFNIDFEIPQFKDLESVYEWICRAIKTIHKIK